MRPATSKTSLERGVIDRRVAHDGRLTSGGCDIAVPPCFTTDAAIRYRYRGIVDDRRVMSPIDDPEANVRFCLAAQSVRAQKVARVF